MAVGGFKRDGRLTVVALNVPPPWLVRDERLEQREDFVSAGIRG